MKKQEQISTALTADQFKEQGERITNVMTGIDTIKGYTKTFMLAMHSKPDQVILLSYLNDYLGQVYEQMEVMYKELDSVAYHLLECDKPEELKNLQHIN